MLDSLTVEGAIAPLLVADFKLSNSKIVSLPRASYKLIFPLSNT
jgi:hypothetical protein